MKLVRITHIVEGFTGGLATYMESILPELACPERSVTLIYSGKRADPDGEAIIEKLQNAGVKVIPIPLKREICVSDFFMFFKLLSILRKGQFDVVHTHCAKSGFLGRLAARIIGVKVICHTPHCFVSSRTKSQLKSKIYICLEKIAASWSHKIIFVSESERMFAIKNGITCLTKSELISNGVSFIESNLSSIENSLFFSDTKNLIVTFAGRLVQYKNPDLIIKAATLLKKRNIEFWVCGDGPELKKIKNLISKNSLDDKVHLVGYVKDMKEIYRFTDVFVMCSDAEGQPYSMLEAMAHECSCIGVISPGIVDILKDGQTGILCEKSEFHISKSIEMLADSELLRQKLSKNAKEYVAHSHSLEMQISMLECLYDKMLLEAR